MADLNEDLVGILEVLSSDIHLGESKVSHPNSGYMQRASLAYSFK